ncbi:hypothetical protein N656DRAFT_559265 [Canariomyces notabilis]|uniref:Uncharacterized protein n=1 Tax=Canariomyces notabilis TaxID=2074819 RepID=A0AAN6QGR7_9PEZI|nr:hypothetical protein N656DRAFT_559265 [Canariomyces arenarius]
MLASKPPPYITTCFDIFVSGLDLDKAHQEKLDAFLENELSKQYSIHPEEKHMLLYLCGLAHDSKDQGGPLPNSSFLLLHNFNDWLIKNMGEEMDAATAMLRLSALVSFERIVPITETCPKPDSWLAKFAELIKDGIGWIPTKERPIYGYTPTYQHMGHALLRVANAEDLNYIHPIFNSEDRPCDDGEACQSWLNGEYWRRRILERQSHQEVQRAMAMMELEQQ